MKKTQATSTIEKAMDKQDKTDARRTIKAVRLDRPGVKSCGPYVPGTVYRVPDDLSFDEAARLIVHKGFTEVED